MKERDIQAMEKEKLKEDAKALIYALFASLCDRAHLALIFQEGEQFDDPMIICSDMEEGTALAAPCTPRRIVSSVCGCCCFSLLGGECSE